MKKIIRGTYDVLPRDLVKELGLTNAYVLSVLRGLQDKTNDGYATVSNSQLAKDCNMSESSIKRAKKELIQKGYIEVSSEKVNKTNTVSKIKVLCEFQNEPNAHTKLVNLIYNLSQRNNS